MNSEKKRKTADLLTICIKAGRAVKGFDSSMDAVKDGKAFCVLTACDASPKTLKEVDFVCGRYEIVHLRRLCGKETAVIAVCDEGFANGFIKKIQK